MVAERDMSVAAMEDSVEEHNTNQVEEKAMSSEKKIAISKVQNMQGGIIAITEELKTTRINKEEAEEHIQKLKSVIRENSRILIINALRM